MLRAHTTAIILVLMATLGLSGCFFDNRQGSSPYGDSYYENYSTYRQVQWDRYGNQRRQMMERERLASQKDRARLARERLAWEKRETDRLRREQQLRAQWERDKARYEQQRSKQPRTGTVYHNW
ncbi:MAG TPA: hypothetical protein DEB25_03080 [Desulfobulbaceae bacterium]|nr:hypothetical protein [Desulfobulbaceae bacterium]